MDEKHIEQYLTRKVKDMGGVAYKFVSPGHGGVPDRLVCLPGGHIAFIELKAPGKKPTERQLSVQTLLCRLGFEVHACVDSLAAVDTLIQRWREEVNPGEI